MIYLDNAATSYPKPPGVIKAIANCLEKAANPGRGGHQMALEASRIIFETREKLADFLGIEDASNLIFTLNATEAINVVLKGILKPGDEVITTTMEHNAVTRPLKALERQGIKVTKVRCSREGELEVGDIAKTIKPETKMVAITMASNVTGTIMPWEEVGKIAKEKSVLFLVDAAQGAGVLPIDLRKDYADFVAFSGHKALLGPQGVGGLYIRAGVELEELKQGGTGSNSESSEQPKVRPDRYESGTPNTPGIAGLGAALDFINKVTVAEIRGREKELTEKLIEGLLNIEGVTVYGPPLTKERAPVVLMNLEGTGPEEVAFALDKAYGLAVRAGLHCAPDAHKTIGTFSQGGVRFSIGYFNSMDDIKIALTAVNSLAKERKGRTIND